MRFSDAKGESSVTKAPALKTVHLRVPASTQDLAALELGTVVYLTGRIFTARQAVYQKAMEDGAGLPAPPSEIGSVNFHCSPAATLNPDGSATVGAVTATASLRFAKWFDGWFTISRCNVIIGKARMTGETYKRHFVLNNAIYLTTVGYGTGALLGRGISVSMPRTGLRRWAWPKPCGS
jgi:L(+)-tartrate dehydratase beta subunit